MNIFIKFMSSPMGRGLRIVAGSGIIVWGLTSIGGMNGYILAGFGILPILTGIFNICVIAPLMGHPIKGSQT